MNTIEMNTIADALSQKQSWVVKGFEDLLTAWKGSTEKMGDLSEKFKKVIVLEKDIQDRCGYVCEERRYFLEIGNNILDYNYTDDRMECWEHSQHYPEITASLVREIMAGDLPSKIRNHFKKVQKEIDVLFKTEEKINELIEKLA